MEIKTEVIIRISSEDKCEHCGKPVNVNKPIVVFGRLFCEYSHQKQHFEMYPDHLEDKIK